MNDSIEHLANRLHALLDKIEPLLPNATTEPDWTVDVAAHWRPSDSSNQTGRLQTMPFSRDILPADLIGIQRQLNLLDTNTRQFLNRLPANNALLWGAKGTGKSSLIRALLNRYSADGLRLIEVDRDDLADLPRIVDKLAGDPQRFIVFCDDLSFEARDTGYKALKTVIDGSVSVAPDNVLIYATSNRRHLVPEYNEENLQAQVVGTEIHHGDVVEEKISLSERFGLWISFHPFSQDQYLAITDHWLKHYGELGIDAGTVREDALRWALQRGSRSGRVAWQFARDAAGKKALGKL